MIKKVFIFIFLGGLIFFSCNKKQAAVPTFKDCYAGEYSNLELHNFYSQMLYGEYKIDLDKDGTDDIIFNNHQYFSSGGGSGSDITVKSYRDNVYLAGEIQSNITYNYYNTVYHDSDTIVYEYSNVDTNFYKNYTRGIYNVLAPKKIKEKENISQFQDSLFYRKELKIQESHSSTSHVWQGKHHIISESMGGYLYNYIYPNAAIIAFKIIKNQVPKYGWFKIDGYTELMISAIQK